MSCDIRSEFRGDDVVVTSNDPLFNLESVLVYDAADDSLTEVRDTLGVDYWADETVGFDPYDDSDWDDDAQVYVDNEGDYDDDAVTEAGW